MTQININVPQEMKTQLEQAGNYSDLIRTLIREHFATKDNLKQKLKILDEKSKMQIEILERQKDKILKQIEIKGKQEQTKKEFEDFRKEKEEEIKINIKANFEFFMGRPITDSELEEYKKGMEEMNLVEFIEKIKERQSKEKLNSKIKEPI